MYLLAITLIYNHKYLIYDLMTLTFNTLTDDLLFITSFETKATHYKVNYTQQGQISHGTLLWCVQLLPVRN